MSSCVSHCVSFKASISSRDSCILCGGSHSLQKCYNFIGFSYDDRVEFIKKNKLCFGCFCLGHQSKDCRSRLKCDVCQKSHSTLLHNPAFLQSKDELCLEKVVSNSVLSDRSISKTSCSIVPVWLSHASIPNCRKLVYALLDSQSDSSFILEENT